MDKIGIFNVKNIEKYTLVRNEAKNITEYRRKLPSGTIVRFVNIGDGIFGKVITKRNGSCLANLGDGRVYRTYRKGNKKIDEGFIRFHDSIIKKAKELINALPEDYRKAVALRTGYWTRFES